LDFQELMYARNKSGLTIIRIIQSDNRQKNTKQTHNQLVVAI